MVLNIYKILIFIFLTFLICCVFDVKGKSVFELEERNETELESFELKLQTVKVGMVEEVRIGANTDKCSTISCQNGGICKIIENQPVCECQEEYKGNKCETHKCDRIICENNGTCEVKRGLARCECPDDYAGDRCTIRLCDRITCRNNGTCKVNRGKAECQCPGYFTGKYCKNIQNDTCSKYQPKCIETGGACIIDNAGNIQCDCPRSGIYRYKTGCQVSCSWRNNPNCQETGGMCITTKDKEIKCRCPEGTEYNQRGCAVPKETCLKYHPTCEETGGICINVNNTKIECKCPGKFKYVTGVGCQISNDDCDYYFSNCIKTGGSCVFNKEGKLDCKCPEGTELLRQGCQVFDPCSSDACENGGTCLTQGRQFRCICKEHFTGKFCENDSKKMCSTYQPFCEETGGFCVIDTDGTFQCQCPKYTSYANDTGCQVLNETCYQYQSNCIESGGFCIFAQHGGVMCICPKGMEYKSKCEVRKGLCSRYIKNCEETGGICERNSDLKIRCVCPWYATFHNDYGCYVSNVTCNKFEKNCIVTGGSCFSTKDGELDCQCPKGMEYQETGCIVQKDMCSRYKKNCEETEGTCVSDKNREIQCKCPNNTSYNNDTGCQKIDLCKKCLNGAGCALFDNDDDPECLCDHNFIGRYCENVRESMCMLYKKNCVETGGTCIADGNSNIHCKCPLDATYYNETGCKDPCSYHPCFNGGQCHVVDSKFECICKKPFSGKYCENDPCNKDPCLNGGQCHIVDNNFECVCKKPFSGKHCEISSQRSIAVYVIIGGLSVLVLILTAALICCGIRLARK